MNKLVYLAGPISNISYENSNNWREYAITTLKESYGLVGLSPMRCKEYLAGDKSIDPSGHEDKVLCTHKAITSRDRLDCNRAGIILMNMLGHGERDFSAGSCIEMGWADAARIPIILVTEKDSRYINHAMIKDVCSFVTDNLDEALSICGAILG